MSILDFFSHRSLFFIEPGPIAKSSIVLDIKPWDDETDLNEIERRVRAIQKDGLIWSKEGKF